MMVSLRDDFKKLVRKSEKTSRFTIIILFIPGGDAFIVNRQLSMRIKV